jgi:putative endonuclease
MRITINKISSTQQTGQAAETLACNHLEKNGLRLVTRNYRCRMGEIDLIMQDKTHLVFIEVRFRSRIDYGSGSESVTHAKQVKLLRTAHYYLQQQGLTEKQACRFDVVAITQDQHNPTIEWIKNAFTN